ncbi:MAG TPA: hypothetical protein VFG81_12655 [Anaerolineales bacterium]|jgi:hypothetical protein|nr:hypothetical protein [Anaerolineales bacterium]
MAKVKKNMIISGVSGSLGPDHYARITKDGRTIISQKPDFGNRQFSEAQLNTQNRTKQAADYAKVASRENPIYAKKAAGTSKNAYNIAFRDWRKPPIIDRIEWRDGKVRVDAYDDTMVTGVVVTILNEEGQCLEQGEAELVLGIWWEYRPAKKGRIHIEARDMAGNVTRQEFYPSSPSFSVWKKTR